MTVTLNIENDAELRAYIKDCIKGQVLSIVREEFIGIVKEEIERKIKGQDEYRFEVMKKDALRLVMREFVFKHYSISSIHKNEFLVPYVEQAVQDVLKNKDLKPLIDQVVKEKLKSLIG